MADSETPTPTSHHRSRTSPTHSGSGSPSSSSYFTFPVTYAVSGLLRRLSSEPKSSSTSLANSVHSVHSNISESSTQANSSMMLDSGSSTLFTPKRTASPFQPPPLTPLSLTGYRSSTRESAKLLTRTLAEEIRLLVPARLQLVEEWRLVYSLEQDGVSLSTLYSKCEPFRGKRGGYVLTIRDSSGGIFGAYLTDAPHPQAHYYGTGECFLWRASILPSIPDLSSLPPPPSSDTTLLGRQTTLLRPKSAASSSNNLSNGGSKSGTSTPERIRFKAFPYSGVNDYMIYAQQEFLSVGGGDGHYGLWLDDNLDKGISSPCPTFGNEHLSDEGQKFDILGVEVWFVG